MTRTLKAAIAAATLLACASSAHANGRAGPPPPSIYAPSWRAGAPAIAARAAWRTGSSVVDEARRWLGSPKFTGLQGPWCADAVSAWLVRTGQAPLPNRLAASALQRGERVSAPAEGELVVMRTNRGPMGHVGIVEGVEPDGTVDIISGNWGGRVAEGRISPRQVTAYVRI